MSEVVINGRFLCQRATGVQRVAREFVAALDRILVRGEFSGLQATLVAPAGADVSSLGLRRVATEHLGGGAGYYWEQMRLPRRAGRTPLLCLGNTAPVVPLMIGRPVAVMLHDQSYRLFPQDYSRAYRTVHGVMGHFIVRRSRPLVTVSQTEAETIRRTNPAMRRDIVVAPNGSLNGDLPVRPSTREDGPPFVLHVGGFSQRKNVDGVFATAVELARRGIGFRLVGQENARSAAFLAQIDPGVRSLISFTGYVDDDRLEWLYRNAACLFYPSFYEASGLPPSEAMSFGCPVVVSDLPVLRERCGAAALYCDPHDLASMVDTVLRVVDDRALAGDLSRRGLDQAKQFTWENQARIVMTAIIGPG